MDSNTAGDPMSDRRWTHETAQKISECLYKRLTISVSASVVRRLLKELKYSLKSNRKCLSSGYSPDRDLQFRIIKFLRDEFTVLGEPIVSVDAKKKELIGSFKNSGRIWCQEAQKVNDHDFPSQALGKATPYGIYEIQRNFGMLVVGQSADTPEFAVNSIVTWWTTYGRFHYPAAKRLLLLADSGGSNGARPRAWKKFLQEKLSDQFGLSVTVAHYPSGASKWNPIEHKMFSEISKNWAGKPLKTFEHVVNFAKNTTTKAGLKIDSVIDDRTYKKGIKVTDKEMAELSVNKDYSLGKWNYTIEPRIQQ